MYGSLWLSLVAGLAALGNLSGSFLLPLITSSLLIGREKTLELLSRGVVMYVSFTLTTGRGTIVMQNFYFNPFCIAGAL